MTQGFCIVYLQLLISVKRPIVYLYYLSFKNLYFVYDVCPPYKVGLRAYLYFGRFFLKSWS